MTLKDLYKTMVCGQKLVIDLYTNIDKVYTVHVGTSDNIPLELLDKHVLQINSDYSHELTLYIIVEE